MLNFGGAVILMQLNIDLNFEVGEVEDFEQIENCKPQKIFSTQVCDFFNALSKKILAAPEAKNFSDVVTFAFWCRKASITKMAENYQQENSRLGRGIIFHIAPSNVAVNFAYSFAAGLLAGNINIIRLPSKNFPQVEIICAAVKAVLADFPALKKYIYFVRYGHEEDITKFLSAICDVRVIWGGDDTIKKIRRAELKSCAYDVTFSDRFGIAVINAEKFLQAENKSKIIDNFFNDTYLTDQNACSSPKFVFWFGKKSAAARNIFWNLFQEKVDKNYTLQDVQAVDKLTNLYLLAAAKNVKFISGANNKITRVEIFEVDSELTNFQGNSGFFIECEISDLKNILPICGRRCQTLAYFGINSELLKNFVLENSPKGIDRIVPIGETLNFNLHWDGYDLINSLSRTIFL